MLQSHQERVKQRCEGKKIILAIQDSTTVLLNGAKKASNIGKIGDLKRPYPGLNIHTALLVSPQQEILGISDLHAFDRQLTEKKNKTHDKLHALKKETGNGYEL